MSLTNQQAIHQNRTSIWIADDHLLFNDGLKLMLEGEPDLIVTQQLTSGEEVISQLELQQPQLMLLDINMPKLNGLELASRVKKQYPQIKIIIVSMYSDQQFVEISKKNGVPGFILKNTSRDELVTCIRTVLDGGTYYDWKLPVDKKVHENDFFIKQFKLTKRELEIISLIRKRHSNQEIANQLFISLYTVETHRRNINTKLNINHPIDLVAFAVEHGL